MNLKQYDFNDYVNESVGKKQIYLHHTAGTGTPQGVFSMWQKNSARIATCVVIGPVSYTGREVKDVIEVPFKKYRYWENYTDAQIESTRELLLLWKDKYGIPLSYNEDIWDVSDRALKGEPGVFTHNSVRSDKVDVYPHPKLIEMLKSL